MAEVELADAGAVAGGVVEAGPEGLRARLGAGRPKGPNVDVLRRENM